MINLGNARGFQTSFKKPFAMSLAVAVLVRALK
jgi:hypothetical protein